MDMIKITCGEVSAIVELLREDAPNTISRILSSLPISSTANRWGEEVYFSTPVVADAENQYEVVEMGDVAYWPPGKALCVFFGPTPASRGEEIRPASPVNVIGKVQGDPRIFSKVEDGDAVTVEHVE
jgi:hypothetical protein